MATRFPQLYFSLKGHQRNRSDEVGIFSDFQNKGYSNDSASEKMSNSCMGYSNVSSHSTSLKLVLFSKILQF